jgi:hypothetical protein
VEKGRRVDDETMPNRLYFYDAAGDIIVNVERQLPRTSEDEGDEASGQDLEKQKSHHDRRAIGAGSETSNAA